MPIEFRCPNCDRLLKTGDEKAGASAKCPQCGTAVLVPAQVAATVPSEQSDDFTQPTATSPGADVGRPDVICPMCGAANEASAPRCLACGEELWPVQGTGDGHLGSRRFGAIWSEAWARWTANLGLSAAAAAIAGGMFLAAYLVFLLLMMVVFGVVAVTRQGDDAFGIVTIAIIVLGYLAMFAIYACVLAGLSNFALRLSRQREGDLNALIPSVSKIGSSLLSTFLIVVALFIAMAPGMALYVYGLVLSEDNEPMGILLVIVGYAAMFLGWGLGWTLFWPVHYVIADDQAAHGSPFVRGVSIALAHPKLSFLLAATNMGLMFAGYTTCYVGLLFAAPLSFILFAVAYNRCARPVSPGFS